MKHAHVLPILLCLFFYQLPAADTISVQTAIERKMVDAKFYSNGVYQGESIRLKIENVENFDLVVRVEPGRNLASKNERAQDLLVVREEILVLENGAKANTGIKAFCSQSSNAAPQYNDTYFVGTMAAAEVVALANRINKVAFTDHTIQHAIWVLTDKHPLASVSRINNRQERDLLKFLSETTGQQIPWYGIEYFETPNAPFVDRPIKIYADFNYNIEDSSLVSLLVYDEHGFVWKSPILNKWQEPKAYSKNMDWYVKFVPKGIYSVRLFVNGYMKEQREIQI